MGVDAYMKVCVCESLGMCLYASVLVFLCVHTYIVCVGEEAYVVWCCGQEQVVE